MGAILGLRLPPETAQRRRAVKCPKCLSGWRRSSIEPERASGARAREAAAAQRVGRRVLRRARRRTTAGGGGEMLSHCLE